MMCIVHKHGGFLAKPFTCSPVESASHLVGLQCIVGAAAAGGYQSGELEFYWPEST